ncbi:MAG TPA: hypothetical protein VLS48_06635 [Anaerolineales bacterium]|nr:hypothetical protein [Anaerolineales bacterium]
MRTAALDNRPGHRLEQRFGNRELWAAFIAILAITGAYLVMVVWLQGIPAASGFFGHSIGELGFIFMLLTETLYSLRKRTRSARWGRMSSWLNFHIFTGIVGPYMVLLHSSWKFNGLAGITLLFTVVVVASGFVGRYIYTAVPRTVDGVALEAETLAHEMDRLQVELDQLVQAQPELAVVFQDRLRPSKNGSTGVIGFFLLRPVENWRQRWRWAKEKRRLARLPLGAQAAYIIRQVEALVRREDHLRSQAASLATARRLLALWHAVHIPIGMALFTAAFIHIAAAIYYATFLR